MTVATPLVQFILVCFEKSVLIWTQHSIQFKSITYYCVPYLRLTISKQVQQFQRKNRIKFRSSKKKNAIKRIAKTTTTTTTLTLKPIGLFFIIPSQYKVSIYRPVRQHKFNSI